MDRHNGTDINKTARLYLKVALWIVAAATLIALLAANVLDASHLVVPVVISAAFSLITCMAYGTAWKGVAKKAPQTLTRFYLAAPVLRMVAAALVIVVYALAVRQPDKVRTFVFVFFIFYILMLIFDSFFFARIEKLNKNHKE